jgi:hypothetical protein
MCDKGMTKAKSNRRQANVIPEGQKTQTPLSLSIYDPAIIRSTS